MLHNECCVGYWKAGRLFVNKKETFDDHLDNFAESHWR